MGRRTARRAAGALRRVLADPAGALAQRPHGRDLPPPRRGARARSGRAPGPRGGPAARAGAVRRAERAALPACRRTDGGHERRPALPLRPRAGRGRQDGPRAAGRARGRGPLPGRTAVPGSARQRRRGRGAGDGDRCPRSAAACAGRAGRPHPPGRDGPAALYRSLLAERRVLIVLDDAPDADAPDADAPDADAPDADAPDADAPDADAPDAAALALLLPGRTGTPEAGAAPSWSPGVGARRFPRPPSRRAGRTDPRRGSGAVHRPRPPGAPVARRAALPAGAARLPHARRPGHRRGLIRRLLVRRRGRAARCPGTADPLPA